jgi:NCAIR mutase (PurE)-related protein
MNETELRKLLEQVQHQEMTLAEAMKQLQEAIGFADLGYARLDTDRERRCGLPEVVFCEGKSPSQITSLLTRLRESAPLALATRATPEIFSQIKRAIPEAVYHEQARLISIGESRQAQGGIVLTLTAGTADIPIAEEAVVTCELMGNEVAREYDVGVAGLHRLSACTEKIQGANVLIVVAGMDGALPSVVGGLVKQPLIAVPTSRGYGASFQGLAALLTMLNSCAPGVAVVNIDNGFGAGVLASRINQMNL